MFAGVVVVAAAVVCSVLSGHSGDAAKALPKYVQVCPLSSPDLNGCFLNATRAIQPYVGAGIPEMGLPPSEPFLVPVVKLQQGTSAVNYKAELRDLQIHGLADYQFKTVELDPQKLSFRGSVHFKSLQLVSKYTISGRVLVVPIQGSGPFTGNFTDATATVVIEGALAKKKSKNYFYTKRTEVKIDVGVAQTQFGNLFNGNEALSKATNQFVNENSAALLNEIRPAVESVISTIVDDIVNKVARVTPYDQLFPKD